MSSVSDDEFECQMISLHTNVDRIDVLHDLFVNRGISRCEAEMTTYTVSINFCVAAICLDGRISVCVLIDKLDC